MRLATKGTETENLFEILVNESPVGLYIIQDGKFCYVNPAFQSTTGYGEDELMGRDALDLVVPQDSETVRENDIKMLKGGLTLPYQFRVTHKDGSIKWITESVVPIWYWGRRATLGYFVDITDRKQAEEALQAEKNKLQSLIDAMEETITIQDTEFNIIYQNEPSRIASAGDHVGEKCYRVYEGKESICEGCPVKKAFKDGKSHTVERMRVLSSGEVTFWENTANPIRDAEGRVVACLEIARNITERKKMEEALKESKERYKELADSITDIFFAMDKNLRYTYWNKASEILTGIRAEDALGKSLREIFPDTPETRNAEKVYRDVLTKRQPQTFVNDFDINGRHYVFEISAYPSRGGISVFVRDITESKWAEEAIKQAAEEWRRTFDSISDAISIHDRDFRIQQANKAFADIFNISPDQIIGKHCYELHKGKKPRSGCPHQQTLTTGKPAATEFYESLLGKYLLESTSPICNENGEVVGTVHITRDITEQKQQNEQLMMADRLASIGELAAGAAHELNNPLTSIIGFSQLLMEKDTPDYIRKNLALICSEAQRAANVTSNLLTFARKHRPVKQLTQINDIIEDVLKLRAYGHKSNRIEVERHLAPDLPEIMVDCFQMEQVFLNIVINAEYFMTEAHKRGILTITTKKQNGTVRISIADDGPGIPPENLNRIFDPFFTSKEAGKGTGLGLSICHGIVAEHGGQIYARSQPGKGATIIIELPINGSDHIESML